MQLPRDPRVGATWSGEHVVGTKKQKRACYCGGIGYVGSDSVVQRSDGKTLKTSDESVKDAE